MMKLLSILFLSCLSASTFASDRITLPFVDEGIQNVEFNVYRSQLKNAVAKKDHRALLELIDINIWYSNAEPPSREGFIALWGLNGPNASSSQLWIELEAVLSLGGAFREGNFVAPYINANWPEDLDTFRNVAIVVESAEIRARPANSSTVVANAGFEILELTNFMTDREWTEVRFDEHGVGYIETRKIRSPLDYHAVFAKIDGKYKMTLFVSGE